MYARPRRLPTPYPNIAQSITLSDGTTTVKGDKAMAANKGSKFALSNGDQAGTLGGVKSNVFMKEATWILYSFDVKLDGANACRLTDPMYHNAENTVNMAGVVQQALMNAGLTPQEAEAICEAFCDVQKKHLDGQLKESPSSAFEKRLNKMREDGTLGPGIFPEQPVFMGEPPTLIHPWTDEGAAFLNQRENFAAQFLEETPLPSNSPNPFSRTYLREVLGKFRALKTVEEGGSYVVEAGGALKTNIRFPDLVVDRGGQRRVFDAKFEWKGGKYDKWSDGQLRDYRKIDSKGEPLAITPAGCECNGPPKKGAKLPTQDRAIAAIEARVK